MSRSRLLTAVVVVLVLTAGCLGSGDGSAASAGDGGSDGGSGDGAASDGGAGGGTDGATGDGTDGATGDGTDGGADGLSLSDSEAALRDAGSFTAAWRYAGTDENGQRGEISFAYAADLNAGRTHIAYSTSDGAQAAGWEVYSTDEVTYTRYGSGDNAFYQTTEEQRNVVDEALSHAGIYGYGNEDELSYEGTETFDGVTVERYVLTESDSIWWGSAAPQHSSDEFTVTDFEYVVLIDVDGLARFESWSFSGETADGSTVTGEWNYSITKLGSTTVTEPDWLAAAEAQAQATDY